MEIEMPERVHVFDFKAAHFEAVPVLLSGEHSGSAPLACSCLV